MVTKYRYHCIACLSFPCGLERECDQYMHHEIGKLVSCAALVSLHVLVHVHIAFEHDSCSQQFSCMPVAAHSSAGAGSEAAESQC